MLLVRIGVKIALNVGYQRFFLSVLRWIFLTEIYVAKIVFNAGYLKSGSEIWHEFSQPIIRLQRYLSIYTNFGKKSFKSLQPKVQLQRFLSMFSTDGCENYT